MINSNWVSHIFKKSSVSRRFTIITVMFLGVLLGLLAYTITTLQKDQSNALLIDMAGRQRMLLQKHMNEVFLTSQGVPADYASTRELIHSTLDALIEGGSIVRNPGTDQHQTVPAVPTKGILEKLREQQNHVVLVFQLADHFLSLSPDHLEFRSQLKTLRTQHALAIQIADEAVMQLGQHSEDTISTMINWEVFIAIVVGLLGVFVTSKSVRDSRKLEKEIEERRRVETALRDSELFLNSIVENIPHMIFVKSAHDLRFVRLNKAGETLLNRSRYELLNKTDYDMFPKEQADFFATKDKEVLAGKKLVDICEEPIQTKSNGLRHLQTKKIPLCDEQGHPQYLLGISEDITERKQAEETLRATEELYRQVLDSILDMVFVKDQNFRILWGNKAFRKFYKMSNEELKGILDSPINAPDFTKKYNEDDAQVLNTGKVLDIPEEPNIRFDGQVRLFHTIKAPLFAKDGEIQKLVGVARDITERKQTEERLRESEVKRIQALRQNDELKSALLSSVSHELRTPLTAIKASVSSILGHTPNDMNSMQQEFLNGIDQEINYMSRLVDNLLDMSQIEAGTLVPHQEWHPLEDLVEGALRHTEKTFPQKNFNILIPENILPVYVDAIGIQQVLINLLDNAAKYSSPDSPIQLEVYSKDQEIIIQISNEGETIPKQELERIFDRFYRYRSQRRQPVRGTGLGLAICKGIIEAHGGQIWAHSSEFKVTITVGLPVSTFLENFSLEGLCKDHQQ